MSSVGLASYSRSPPAHDVQLHPPVRSPPWRRTGGKSGGLLVRGRWQSSNSAHASLGLRGHWGKFRRAAPAARFLPYSASTHACKAILLRLSLSKDRTQDGSCMDPLGDACTTGGRPHGSTPGVPRAHGPLGVEGSGTSSALQGITRLHIMSHGSLREAWRGGVGGARIQCAHHENAFTATDEPDTHGTPTPTPSQASRGVLRAWAPGRPPPGAGH